MFPKYFKKKISNFPPAWVRYLRLDKSKFSNRKRFKQTSHPAKEIWNTKLANINIENFYFEEIEAELITEVITD